MKKFRSYNIKWKKIDTRCDTCCKTFHVEICTVLCKFRKLFDLPEGFVAGYFNSTIKEITNNPTLI